MIDRRTIINEINGITYDLQDISLSYLFQIQNKFPKETICMPALKRSIFGPAFITPNQNIMFKISQEIYFNIKSRPDLNIILLCRFIDNRLNMIHWPVATYEIFINGQPQSINHKYYSKVPLPFFIYLKDKCLQDTNVIRFASNNSAIENCFEFHIFACIETRLFNTFKATFKRACFTDLLSKIVVVDCKSMERNFVVISKYCPLSNIPIHIPIRFRECRHTQPIDLYSFLTFYSHWMLTMCPVCGGPTNFDCNQEDIVIDNSLKQIFEDPKNFSAYYFQLNERNYKIITEAEYNQIKFNERERIQYLSHVRRQIQQSSNLSAQQFNTHAITQQVTFENENSQLSIMNNNLSTFSDSLNNPNNVSMESSSKMNSNIIEKNSDLKNDSRYSTTSKNNSSVSNDNLELTKNEANLIEDLNILEDYLLSEDLTLTGEHNILSLNYEVNHEEK